MAFGDILEREQDTGTGNLSWTFSQTPADGELILIFVMTRGSDAGSVTGFGSVSIQGTGFADWLTCFYKVANGESGATYTWVEGVVDQNAGIAYRMDPGDNGFAQGLLLEDSSTVYNASATTSLAIPQVDTSAKALWVASVGFRDFGSAEAVSFDNGVTKDLDLWFSGTGNPVQVSAGFEVETGSASQQINASWTNTPSSGDVLGLAIGFLEALALPQTHTFTGTNGSSWDAHFWDSTGTSDDGIIDIQSNTGHLAVDESLANADDYAAAVAAWSTGASEMLVKIDPGNVTNNNNFWLYLILRSSGEIQSGQAGRPATGIYWRIKLATADSGTNDFFYDRVSNLESSTANTTGFYHDGTVNYRGLLDEVFWCRFRVTDEGAEVRVQARGWIDGNSEPSTWNVLDKATDDAFFDTWTTPERMNGVTGVGHIVYRWYNSSTTQGDIYIDDLTLSGLAINKDHTVDQILKGTSNPDHTVDMVLSGVASPTISHTTDMFIIDPASSWLPTTGDLLEQVMESAEDNELYHVESVTTGTTTWTHDGTSREILVLLMTLGEKQAAFFDNVGGTNKSVPVLQIIDRNYRNP